MSFGFSVGDIIAVGRLAYDLSMSLGGGAKEEYRTICSSLKSLSQSLDIAARVYLDSNTFAASNTSLDLEIAEGIKAELDALKEILNSYKPTIREYKQTLDKKHHRIKYTWRILKWSLNHEGTAKELEAKLLFHTNTFQSYVLEVIHREVSKAGEHIKEGLDKIKEFEGSINKVKGSVNEVKDSVNKVKESVNGVEGSATEVLNGFRQIRGITCLVTTAVVLLYMLFPGILPTAHPTMNIGSAVSARISMRLPSQRERRGTLSSLNVGMLHVSAFTFFFWYMTM